MNKFDGNKCYHEILLVDIFVPNQSHQIRQYKRQNMFKSKNSVHTAIAAKQISLNRRFCLQAKCENPTNRTVQMRYINR